MQRQLRQFDISDDPDAIVEGIARDGGAIVRRFIPEALRQRLESELGPYADNFAAGTPGGVLKQVFSGAQTKRFSGLPAKAPSFAEVIDHRLLHHWAESVFKTDYWVNTGQAMIVGPGSPAQILHRDCGNWPVMMAMGRDGPEATLSLMLAVSDFTAENGATRVAPGSHRWDDFDAKAKPDEVVQAVMPAGSAMLYTGKTIHGAGANLTHDQVRFGVHLSFVLAQLTPEEALPLTVPWAVAQGFSERVQHMLGFHSHRTFLPDWPSLWLSDYRELRDSLSPPASHPYVSAGARMPAPAALAARAAPDAAAPDAAAPVAPAPAAAAPAAADA
jgi:ectoine hydroxylase-related dioxygenase (phytanoyl-CoA dioxygenase family)